MLHRDYALNGPIMNTYAVMSTTRKRGLNINPTPLVTIDQRNLPTVVADESAGKPRVER